MNERINELELEAIAYADSKVPAMDRYNDIYHSIVRGKFAELIVRDCIEQLRLVPYGSDTIEFGEEVPYQDAIKKHFGVEE